MRKHLPVSALAAMVAALSSQAQERMEETVVVSSRVEMPLRHIGTSVSVLSAQDIRLAGYNSLFDVLRGQASVAASNSGGAGKATSLSIRGEDGFRTLVLVDGIDISDTASPQVGPRVEHLLSDGVSRVEILRGPQGIMYGADAGGVINISTAAPGEDLAGSVSAEGGSYGTGQLAASLRGGGDVLDGSLLATGYRTDGFNARSSDDVLRDDDGYRNRVLHGRAGWNVTERLRLEVVGRDTRADNEFDGCYSAAFEPSDDCDNDYDQQAWRLAARHSGDRFSNELSYAGNHTESNSFTLDQPTFGSKGELARFNYLGSFRAAEALQLVYGLERKTEAIDDGVFDRRRWQNGAFAEYQGSFFEQLFVTVGARYDDNEDFGGHTSARVSGAYLFALGGGEAKLRGAYGTGFRAPSLYEIAYNQSDWAYPPASATTLSEERSRGFDVGLGWRGAGGAELEATYFDQTIADEIYFDLDGFSGYLQDAGDSRSSGVELQGAVPLPAALLLGGNYTYNHTEAVDGSLRLRRPRHLFNVSLRWQPLAARLVLGLHARGAFDVTDVLDGVPVAGDDYTVCDVTASYDVLDGLQVFGRVENLLDADYQEVAGYNTSARAGYAGLRYAF